MVYNLHMKILIAPFIRSTKNDAAYYISNRLSRFFSERQHAVAVSTSLRSSVPSAALYEAAEPKRPRFFRNDYYSYEEWLYSFGALAKDYLHEDTEFILDAIDEFEPDAVICIDRPAAVIASRVRKIPCLPIINTAMYRNASLSIKIMQGINQVLSEYDLEQVFRIHTLYDSCTSRLIFGPLELQPLPPEVNVKRFGTLTHQQSLPEKSDGVYICFHELNKKPAAVRKMILEAFSGARYPVYCSVSGLPAEKVQNIHFITDLKEDILRQSGVCIHDGNDYICDICAANAIPQLIVTDHRYGRTANALAARRYGFGIMEDEAHLSVAALYENYRRLVVDQRFREAALAMREEIISLGDSDDLYRLILSLCRK